MAGYIPDKRFRVALSFPGEKRAFVENVAESLARKLGPEKVLYDKWYEAEFARADLGTYLPDLYRLQTDLVVAFFSRHYVERDWCGAEWRAIQTLIHRQRPEAVMLCRFDRQAEVPGIYETAGFVEIEDETDLRANEVGEWILGRLPTPGIVIPEGPFVCVCEPAGDVEGEHVRLVKDLTGALKPLGITVIDPGFRKKPQLIDTIPDLLAAAQFVVQLHGRTPIPAPYDAFGSTIEYWLIQQLRRLCELPTDNPVQLPNKVAGRTWLRWRSDALKEEQIADETHRAVVFDESHEVIALPEVKFREFVVQTVQREMERKSLPKITETAVLVRSTVTNGPATGDMCDRVDLYTNSKGERPLRAQVMLPHISLQTYCEAYRERAMQPGGLFVVYEAFDSDIADSGKAWVYGAMKECRTVALTYNPRLPVCLVYAAKADNEEPRLEFVPGRFRVVTYRPPDPGAADDTGGPLEPEVLNEALRQVEQLQQ